MSEKELDKIKSSIAISLGTKNKLRKLKGNESYENFINHLLRLRNQIVHNPDNLLEIQRFIRKKAIYNFESFKIIFSYNQYNESNNFVFDINIEKVRENGKQVSFNRYVEELSRIMQNDLLEIEYRSYFYLITIAIQKEIEPLFKHNGRFEDYYSWEREYELLNISRKSFEEDIMDKLHKYKKGVSIFND